MTLNYNYNNKMHKYNNLLMIKIHFKMKIFKFNKQFKNWSIN